jgi:hypothetical protein
VFLSERPCRGWKVCAGDKDDGEEAEPLCLPPHPDALGEQAHLSLILQGTQSPPFLPLGLTSLKV